MRIRVLMDVGHFGAGCAPSDICLSQGDIVECVDPAEILVETADGEETVQLKPGEYEILDKDYQSPREEKPAKVRKYSMKVIRNADAAVQEVDLDLALLDLASSRDDRLALIAGLAVALEELLKRPYKGK